MSTSPIVPSSPEQSGAPAHLGSILLSGADARSFLQGQLTADLDTLDPHRVLLAACNSPQGRVQAVLRIIERGDGIALILPGTMVETIAARLRKYVLRSKVKIEPGAKSLALIGRDALPANVAPAGAHAHHEHAGTSYIHLPGHEQILVLDAPAASSSDSAAHAQWHLDDIRAGLPQVYPQTHEAFVAQMLNLDLLDGISFEKGCYTGQEIIARTHFRGAIKRRMFRFTASCLPPAPGTRILAGEAHAGDVVDAAASGEGSELLAVVSLAHAQEQLRLELVPVVELKKEPLPYVIAG